jgi:predicted NUDIX family phosphoesterase
MTMQAAVLAARSRHLPQQPCYDCDEDEALEVVERSGLCIGGREWLELDEDFRQIIPYVVLRDAGKLLHYQRSSQGNESRLHGRFSLGFGGHIDLEDVVAEGSVVDLRRTIGNSARRELIEEVGLQPDQVRNRQFLGLICSSSSEVERVHLGWVEVWNTDLATIAPTDPTVVHLAPITVTEAIDQADQYEEWSRHTLALLTNHGDQRA